MPFSRDTALSQQIAESLAHSGVMSNFSRRITHKKQQKKSSSEYAQTRKTKWHDLSYTERIEAAAQVHAVVFAQLGALAHSMIELGCGLERSCAFVRRMSIRNQLPSSQRTMLLTHLMQRDDVGRRESLGHNNGDDEVPAMGGEPPSSEETQPSSGDDLAPATDGGPCSAEETMKTQPAPAPLDDTVQVEDLPATSVAEDDIPPSTDESLREQSE